ncbi:cyanophycinase [Novosphingobium sp.]|uniref:cyanophycinase n=1 Tax=Novosphingobium sp. TaxID=1874826 RepID=UPI0026234347|nr:cyanophycinase [Novosphingobium sp.]
MPRFFAFVLSLILTIAPVLAAEAEAPLERYVYGNPDVPREGAVSGGLLLNGGGARNPQALRWFFEKAGRGHIVILSASFGKDTAEEFMRHPQGPLSVEVLIFHARAQATDPAVLASIARADGIFISGGDQSRYVNFWRGTEVARLLDAHVAAGKPLGGTSAGLAMLGEKLYGAMDDGSVTSKEALAQPFGPANTIEGDFLHLPLLQGVITDSHFKERDRLGRLFAFLAKAQMGRATTAPAMIGLGIDEDTALVVEPDGSARIHAQTADGLVWIVDGTALRDVAPPMAPLTSGMVKVTVADANSRIHLPSGRVERPREEQVYRASEGTLVRLSTKASISAKR